MDTVSIITLGCPKNTVDSERMHRLLELNGYAVGDDPAEADVIVVNTCGFIQPAKEESIDTILDAADYKQSGRCRGLIVTGCLAQRYTDDLRRDLPEADIIFGLKGEADIVAHCDRLLGRSRSETHRFAPTGDDSRHIHTPAHWAYLRISDGCDRSCAFCAIPGIRGRNVSTPIEVLVAETHRLVAGGVREAALIAQDTMRYGADIYGTPSLVPLLQGLLEVPGLDWIRLLYTYPTLWRDDLIDLLASEPRLCAYVDMPVQHAADPVLKAMNRGTTRDGTRRLIQRLRARVPGLTLRSSVILGFPGETEAHFQDLLSFVEETRFNRLVAFEYSHEDNTAAGELDDDVPAEVKKARIDEVLALQETISSEINESLIGSRFRVLVEAASADDDHPWAGRTRMDAPEIDGEVLFSGPGAPGAFVDVEITAAAGYDLFGRAVGPPDRSPIDPSSLASAVPELLSLEPPVTP